MADLNIIYRIAADISGLQDGVNRAAKSTEKLEGLASKVSTAFAGMFTVSAAVSFGKAILDDANALVKLSDRTGVSIEGLQRLQVAGDDAGNTIDEMTAAITKLQDKLGSGDRSATRAMEELGIVVSNFKRLNPDQQFIALSDALRQVDDPARQVSLAIDLMGKSGATVLPTLKRGFDDVRGSAVAMSEDTVRALDEMSDRADRLWRTIKGGAATAAVHMIHFWEDGFNPSRFQKRLIDDMTESINRMHASVQALPKDVAAPLVVPTSDSAQVARAIRESDAALRQKNESLRDAKRAADAVVEANERFRDSVVNLTSAANGAAEGFGAYGLLMPDLSAHTLQLADQTVYLASALDATVDDIEALQRAGRFTSAALVGLNNELMTMPAGAANAGEALKELREEAEDGISIFAAFGKSLKDIWTGISGGNDIAGMFDNLGKGIIDQFGALITGGITNLISTGIGLLGKGLSKLFGGLFGGEEKKINPIREAFVQEAGGLAELNRQVMEATGSLALVHQLLDAENAKEYEAAVRAISEALREQKERAEEVNDEVASGGEAVEEAEAKTNAVLDALMAKRQSLSESIANEAPEEVMGVIEAQTRGQIDALDAAIKSQQDEMARQAEATAQKIEDELNGINPDIITIEYEYKPRDGGLPPWTRDFPTGEAPEPVPMALGGMGTVTRPTLFLAGEAGPEQFAFSGSGKTFDSGGSARPPVIINNHFNGILTDGPAVRRALDQVVGTWMPDAILRDVGGVRRSVRRASAG